MFNGFFCRLAIEIFTDQLRLIKCLICMKSDICQTIFIRNSHHPIDRIFSAGLYLHFITSADKFVEKNMLIKPFSLMRQIKLHV